MSVIDQSNDLIERIKVLQMATKVVEYDEGGFGVTYSAVPVGNIASLPAVDAVPVVRCSCCELRRTLACPMYCADYKYDCFGERHVLYETDETVSNGFCDRGRPKKSSRVETDDFCSPGERGERR